MTLLPPIYGQTTNSFDNPGESLYFSGDYEACLIEYTSYLSVNSNLLNNVKHSLITRSAFIAAWCWQDSIADELIILADSLNSAGVTPDTASLADRKLYEAVGLYYQNDYTGSADLLLESSQLRNKVDPFEKAILADTYGFLGEIYNSLEDYTTSVRYYEKAILIDRELNRSFILADQLTGLAIANRSIDPYNSMIDRQLDEALNIFTDLKDTAYQAYVNNEYGILYSNRNDLSKSFKYIRESARLKELLKDRAEYPERTFNNLGQLFGRLNQPDSAIYFIKKAIVEVESKMAIYNYREINSLAKFNYNLGRTFGILHSSDSALFYFNRAIEHLIPANMEQTDSSLQTIVHPDLPQYLSGKANELNNLYEKTGNTDFLKRSLETYEIALHNLDVLRFLYSFENKALAVRENRSYYRLALENAAEYYEHTLNKKDLEKAFLLAGRSKGLVFDEYLRMSEAREFMNSNPDLIRRDDSLKMMRSSLIQRTYEFAQDQVDSISLYESNIFDIDNELAILQREIKEKTPAYYKSIHSTQEYPSETIQAKLKADELLLDFTWHKNQLIIFAISTGGFELYRIDVPPELRSEIGKYSKFLSGWTHLFSDLEFKNISFQLYNSILKPIEPLLQERTLYIIPDDSLALLPFETLIYQKVDDGPPDYSSLPYLIRKNPISYFHSIQQFVMNKGEKPLSSSGVMAFAPFEDEDYIMGDNTLNMLNGSKEEIRTIKDQLPTKLFEEDNATEKNFRNALQKDKIIHVATHGLQADSTPMQNHILFYPGRNNEDHKFHLSELLSMQVQSPLIVLSSCNTGAGTFQPGEGVLSLARAFHFAGAPSLVMSLWPVDDEVAIDIMDEFYSNIKQGMSLTKSLQLAKCSYIESAGKAKASPRYWASFQLTGYSDEIIIKKAGINSSIIVIGTGIIILLIILLRVRLYLKKRNK